MGHEVGTVHWVSHYCDKIPHKNNLAKKGFFKYHGGKVMNAGASDHWFHCSHSGEAETIIAYSQLSSVLFGMGPQPMEWQYSHLRWVFPLPFSPEMPRGLSHRAF